MSSKWRGGRGCRGWRIVQDGRAAYAGHRWGSIPRGRWYVELEFLDESTGEWQVWDRSLVQGREEAFRMAERFVLGSAMRAPRGRGLSMLRWVAGRRVVPRPD